MINGQYVAFINPAVIVVVGIVLGIAVYICTGEGIWGWFAFFCVIVLGIAINHAFREHWREEWKEWDEQWAKTKEALHDMHSVPANNMDIERKYMEHYKATKESIMENEFIPQYYKAYMAQEVSVWQQMQCPRMVDGHAVSSLAYTVYGEAKAWEAMLNDKACRPSVVEAEMRKTNGRQWEERYDVVWSEWKKSGYESFISKFNRTGDFEAPWCKRQLNLPDWMETDSAKARNLGSKSKSE